MLSIGPWNRLPLTIRWLNQEYVKDFQISKTPPMHMPICYGPVISKKIDKINTNNSCTIKMNICNICCKIIDRKILTCLNSDCNIVSHIICMAKYFKKESDYVPIEGNCPNCLQTFLWGDIIRKFKGCYNNCDIKINIDNVDMNFYSSSDSD